MNMVFRNFFYAVGFVILMALHGLDADTAQFAVLVRFVQSQTAMQMVLVLTAILVGLDLIWGIGGRRAGVSSSVQVSNGATSTETAKSIGA